MLNDSALSREGDTPYLPFHKESPLKSGYESSGNPHGRLTNDSTGRMGRLGPNRSGLQFRPYNALADSLTSCFARESSLTRTSLFSMGTSLAPTPHNHIKNSLNS